MLVKLSKIFYQMNSTTVLTKPKYKISNPVLCNVSGATGFDTYIRMGSMLSLFSTMVSSAESISLNNKLQIQRVKDLAKLDSNWDGDNSLKINEVSIKNAISLIESLNDLSCEVYFTAPGPNSDILIQLKNNYKEIEFILYPNKSKFVLFSNNSLVEQGNLSFGELPNLINWLNCD